MLVVLFSASVLVLGNQPVAAAAKSVQTVTPSANYAGYSAIGQQFTAIVADFAVPDLQCVGFPNASAAGFWVGLGAAGHRALEQVGVTSNCGNGVINIRKAFYETIGGGKDTGPQTLDMHQYSVQPRDLMHAEVAFEAPDQFTYTLQDYTEWWTFTTTVTQGDMGGALDSADFVVENPGENLSLTRFDSFHFEGCFVNGGTLLTDTSLVRWEMHQGGTLKAQAGELSPYGGRGPNFDVAWKNP